MTLETTAQTRDLAPAPEQGVITGSSYTAPAQNGQPGNLNICNFSIQNLFHRWVSNCSAEQIGCLFPKSECTG